MLKTRIGNTAQPPIVEAPKVGLRPALATDEDFCRRLFLANYQLPLLQAGLDEQQRSVLLRLQFASREMALVTNNPDASHEIIVTAGEAIGRILIKRQAKNLHLLDIALLPEWHRRGIGGALLHSLCREADASARDVTLQVAIDNPAQRLYARHGFEPVSDDGVYQWMRRRAMVQAPRPKKQVKT